MTSKMEKITSFLCSAITQDQSMEVFLRSVDKSTDGVETGHIFVNEITPAGLEEWHIVVHETHKPAFVARAEEPKFEEDTDHAAERSSN